MTKKKKHTLVLWILFNVLVFAFGSKQSIDVKAGMNENIRDIEETAVEETTTYAETASEKETTSKDIIDTTIAPETTIYNNQETTTCKYGFYKQNGHTYYYLKNGKKAIGFKKIKNGKYYFDKKGRMVKGLKKIKRNRYYFKKSGKMHCGFLHRKLKKKKILSYFDKKGRLKTGKFKVKKVTYKARAKSGEIYYLNNNVVPVCQRPQLPTGCEITAWTMMVQYAGKRMDKITAANIMPRSGNPNRGFMGSPYFNSGHGEVVYPDGLAGIT